MLETGPADHEVTACQKFEPHWDPQTLVFDVSRMKLSKPALVIHQRGFPCLMALTSGRCTALEVRAHHVIFPCLAWLGW